MRRAAFLLFCLLPLAGFTVSEDIPAPAPRLDDLNQVLQDRFGNLTEEDIHQGRLGVSRVAVPALRRVFIPANDRERAPLTRLREEGWSASLYFVGVEKRLHGPIRTSPEAFPAAVDRAEVVKLGKGAIEKRTALQGILEGVRLEARPIPMSAKNCAGCHDPNLKDGDPLGAVVFVLRRAASP